MSEILLPPMNAQQEAKTKRLMDLIGEYMGDEVKCESVISMRIVWPDDRPDMGMIFKKLAGNKKGLNNPAAEKMNGSKNEIITDKDELVQKAIGLFKGEKYAYGSKLKESLHIGYPSAVSLMEKLEKMGIVGPEQEGKLGCEVLMKEGDGVEETADLIPE